MGYDDDPANLLTVSYAADPDGTGKMHVRAAAGGFAGESAAWIDTSRLADFASSLSTYPIADDETITIWGGFGANPRTGQPAQEHVALVVGPVGSKGQVGVRVHLATPEWANTRPESVNDVRLELLATYERLRHFRAHLLMVIQGRLDEATLGVEVLR